MDNSFGMQIIIMILEGIVPIAITAFGILIYNFLKKKGASEDQLQLLDRAYGYLQKAVISTNQVWVDALKQSNGHLTKEQQAEARRQTEETFKAMITETVQLAIETAYGSIDQYLAANLEAAVGTIKKS